MSIPANKFWINHAKEIAQMSNDPVCKVGAVIVDKHDNLISTGYNKIPGIYDQKSKFWQNRDIKLRSVIHAEEAAIINCPGKPVNKLMYVWPHQPCAHCASVIIESGIKYVFCPYSESKSWDESWHLAIELFYNTGVKLIFVKE